MVRYTISVLFSILCAACSSSSFEIGQEDDADAFVPGDDADTMPDSVDTVERIDVDHVDAFDSIADDSASDAPDTPACSGTDADAIADGDTNFVDSTPVSDVPCKVDGACPIEGATACTGTYACCKNDSGVLMWKKGSCT